MSCATTHSNVEMCQTVLTLFLFCFVLFCFVFVTNTVETINSLSETLTFLLGTHYTGIIY